MLYVGDGHQVDVERCGTKGAKPALFLHGGPAGGIAPEHRRQFDPERYDLLLFDQRGCGNSTPYASLEAKTTWPPVPDIERLRRLICVDHCLVCVASWDSRRPHDYSRAAPTSVHNHDDDTT